MCLLEKCIDRSAAILCRSTCSKHSNTAVRDVHIGVHSSIELSQSALAISEVGIRSISRCHEHLGGTGNFLCFEGRLCVFVISGLDVDRVLDVIGTGVTRWDPEQPRDNDQLHERGRVRESERHLPSHRHRKRAVAYRAHDGGHPRAIRYAWVPC